MRSPSDGHRYTCHCGTRHSERIPFLCKACADVQWAPVAMDETQENSQKSSTDQRKRRFKPNSKLEVYPE